MQTIIIRIILNEENHGLKFLAPKWQKQQSFQHEEFFVLLPRETLSVSLLSNQPGAELIINYLVQNSLFVSFASFFINSNCNVLEAATERLCKTR